MARADGCTGSLEADREAPYSILTVLYWPPHQYSVSSLRQELCPDCSSLYHDTPTLLNKGTE